MLCFNVVRFSLCVMAVFWFFVVVMEFRNRFVFLEIILRIDCIVLIFWVM